MFSDVRDKASAAKEWDRLINLPAEGPRSPESGPQPRTGDTTGAAISPRYKSPCHPPIRWVRLRRPRRAPCWASVFGNELPSASYAQRGLTTSLGPKRLPSRDLKRSVSIAQVLRPLRKTTLIVKRIYLDNQYTLL